jgi:hypothetical protein
LLLHCTTTPCIHARCTSGSSHQRARASRRPCIDIAAASAASRQQCCCAGPWQQWQQLLALQLGKVQAVSHTCDSVRCVAV